MITTRSEVVLKVGVFDISHEPFMNIIAKYMSGKILSAFEYLVEYGRPYEGKHSTPPRISPVSILLNKYANLTLLKLRINAKITQALAIK